jgi:hypothetical protein
MDTASPTVLLAELDEMARACPWWDGSTARTLGKRWCQIHQEVLVDHTKQLVQTNPKAALIWCSMREFILDRLAPRACEEYVESMRATVRGEVPPPYASLILYNAMIYGLHQVICGEHESVYLDMVKAPDWSAAERTSTDRVFAQNGSTTMLFDYDRTGGALRITFFMIPASQTPTQTTHVGPLWFEQPFPIPGGPAITELRGRTIYVITTCIRRTSSTVEGIEAAIIPESHFGTSVADYVEHHALATASEDLKRHIRCGLTMLASDPVGQPNQN